MTTTQPKNSFWTLMAMGLALSGCAPSREEFLWILGSNLFLLYAVSLVAVLLLQKLHNTPAFLGLVERIRTPASIAGWLVGLVGVWFILTGIPALLDEAGPDKLQPFLGIMILIAGVHLCLWARTPDAAKKGAHAKVLALSCGFIVGGFYIASGAGMLNPG